MLVRSKVVVKAVVTTEYKDRLISQLSQALSKVEASLHQLEVQGRQYLADLEGADSARAAEFREKLTRQKLRQEQAKTSLSARLAEVRNMEIGSEHPHTALEGLSELNVGDNLAEKLRETEVLVKDDVIVEIRNAR